MGIIFTRNAIARVLHISLNTSNLLQKDNIPTFVYLFFAFKPSQSVAVFGV